jgi:hypothetical protein
MFGKEPALIVGFIGAVLTFLVSLNLGFLDAGAAAAILSLITGIVTAATTRPIAPGLYAGIAGAAAAVLAEYGTNVSEATVAGVSGLILAGFALFGVRNQVSPARAGASVG